MRIHKDDLARLAGLDRRQFLMALAAAGGGLAMGASPSFADTTVNWIGWQGYDEPLKVGTFLKDNGISLATTYINSTRKSSRGCRRAAPAKLILSPSILAMCRS